MAVAGLVQQQYGTGSSKHDNTHTADSVMSANANAADLSHLYHTQSKTSSDDTTVITTATCNYRGNNNDKDNDDKDGRTVDIPTSLESSSAASAVTTAANTAGYDLYAFIASGYHAAHSAVTTAAYTLRAAMSAEQVARYMHGNRSSDEHTIMMAMQQQQERSYQSNVMTYMPWEMERYVMDRAIVGASNMIGETLAPIAEGVAVVTAGGGSRETAAKPRVYSKRVIGSDGSTDGSTLSPRGGGSDEEAAKSQPPAWERMSPIEWALCGMENQRAVNALDPFGGAFTSSLLPVAIFGLDKLPGYAQERLISGIEQLLIQYTSLNKGRRVVLCDPAVDTKGRFAFNTRCAAIHDLLFWMTHNYKYFPETLSVKAIDGLRNYYCVTTESGEPELTRVGYLEKKLGSLEAAFVELEVVEPNRANRLPLSAWDSNPFRYNLNSLGIYKPGTEPADQEAIREPTVARTPQTAFSSTPTIVQPNLGDNRALDPTLFDPKVYAGRAIL